MPQQNETKEDLAKRLIDEVVAEDATENLEDIRQEMLGLLQRAHRVILDIRRNSSTVAVAERANAYWYPHIAAALGDENYATQYDTTMLTTVRELKGLNNDNEASE